MPKQLSSFVAKLNSSLKLSEVQESGDYPVYGASGLVGYLNSYQTDVESVAIIKDGAGVGRTQIIPPKSSVLGTIQLLKPLPGIDAIYVKFLLDSMHLGNSFTGATIPHIYFRDYGQRIVPEHKPNQRRAISRSLSSITDGIAKARRQLSLLDEQVKSLFNEMFFNAEIGTVPLRSVANVGSSKRVFTEEFVDEGVPFYRGSEIGQLSKGIEPENPFRITREHYLRLITDKGKPQPGDILMPSICDKGQLWIVDGREFYYKDGRVLSISPNRAKVKPRFLRDQLRITLTKMFKEIATGATFAEYKIVTLKEIPVFVPNMDIQAAYCERAEQIDKLRFNYQKQIDLLNELMEKKMEEYFGGEEDA